LRLVQQWFRRDFEECGNCRFTQLCPTKISEIPRILPQPSKSRETPKVSYTCRIAPFILCPLPHLSFITSRRTAPLLNWHNTFTALLPLLITDNDHRGPDPRIHPHPHTCFRSYRHQQAILGGRVMQRISHDLQHCLALFPHHVSMRLDSGASQYSGSR
jgi:hypothetical protein